ncbi:MAG: M20/M25/M40 family metallo-hydrolase [Alphaproteobacteria bacterium]|nr:M20/M25/M40 family metallo-hydrolase [Alphaproteobacteria bacterium]
MSTDIHGALARWVDARHAEQVALLAAIVRLPTDTPPGDNALAAERIATLLEARGHAVERHPVDLAALPGYGLKSAVNLVARKRFGPGGRTIALNAHGDVVPPGAGWTRPPYGAIVEDGRMYGRGVAVSKSDIAAYAFAVEALAAAAPPRAGAVELHVTFDEELGGLAGPAWLLERDIVRPDLAICAGFSYGVVTAHNGCLHLEATLRGQAAHAATPESGRDAIKAALSVAARLYALQAEIGSRPSQVPGIGAPTLNIGTIAGGINANVVPDRAVLAIERRTTPEEDQDAAERALRAAIESAAASHDGISVAIRRLLRADPLRPAPGQAPLAALLQAHGSRIFDTSVAVGGSPLYTDARHYGRAGCPAVLYGAGPRTILEANAKRADENLLLDDLRRATQVIAATLRDLLE